MKRKIFIISILILMFGVVFLSIREAVKMYVPTLFEYDKVVENCPGKNPVCKRFRTESELENYIEYSNPHDTDAISFIVYATHTTSFSIFIYIFPIIAMIIVLSKVHNEIKTGYFENILLRTKYRDMIKKYIYVSLKSCLIVPIIYIIICIISCILTKFNFNIDIETTRSMSFTFDHFPLYSILVLFGSYIVNFGFSLAGIFIAFKSKSKSINIFLCILYYIIMVVTYVFLGVCIFRDTYNMPQIYTEYFFIVNMPWLFTNGTKYYIAYLISTSMILINVIIMYLMIGTKEKAILSYEKITS